jgi:hypothetical protein
MEIGEAIIPPLKAISQPRAIEAEWVEERCAQVVDVDGVFGQIVPDVIALALNIKRRLDALPSADEVH